MVLRKILFIGMPGSGKGTQAKLLVPYNFKQISTGDLIREAWEREDPLVMAYKIYIEEGGFLPDKEIFELIDREIRLLEGAEGYILDGAIRNTTQAETALQRNLIGEVLFFDLSEEEAIKRMGKRFKIEGRKDDSPEVVTRRLEKYKKETEPVIDYLRENNISVHTINAHPSIKEIHREILKILKLNK